MKKIFKIIFLIIILLIISCLLLVFFDPLYNRKNTLTINDIGVLLSKSGHTPNYYYKVEESSSNITNTSNDTNNVIKREYFIKDNFIKEILTMQNGGKSIYWEDSNTGELIMIYYSQKKIIVSNTNMGTLGISSEAKQNGIDLSNNMKYKFLGRTTINNRSTVVIKLYHELNKEYYYIDEDTGIIIKIVYKGLFHSSADTKNIVFNKVTNNDILKPDLDDYSEYQISYNIK